MALIQGWATFRPFSVGDFIDAYILLPAFAIVYVGYKLWFKTKLVNLADVDINDGRRLDLDIPKDEIIIDGQAQDYENNDTKRKLKAVGGKLLSWVK